MCIATPRRSHSRDDLFLPPTELFSCFSRFARCRVHNFSTILEASEIRTVPDCAKNSRRLLIRRVGTPLCLSGDLRRQPASSRLTASVKPTFPPLNCKFHRLTLFLLPSKFTLMCCIRMCSTKPRMSPNQRQRRTW